MSTKPLQQDEEGNIINDVQTKKNQQGYANYEAEQARKQAEREKPKPVKPVAKAKGGMVGSASKRADGCCIRGKTRA